MKKLICLFIMAVLVSGCAGLNSYAVNPYTNTIQYNEYQVQIISNPPGAKIEVNNDYIGEAPLIWHAHGSQGMLGYITIKANPIYPRQFVQTKILPGNSPLPRTIYFDMNLAPQSPEYNINIQNR